MNTSCNILWGNKDCGGCRLKWRDHLKGVQDEKIRKRLCYVISFVVKLCTGRVICNNRKSVERLVESNPNKP